MFISGQNPEAEQKISWEWELAIEETGDEFIVVTGKVEFHVGRATFCPFSQVILGNSGVMDLAQSRLVLTDNEEEQWEARVDRSAVESINPCKSLRGFLTATFPQLKRERRSMTYVLSRDCRSGPVIVAHRLRLRSGILKPRCIPVGSGIWGIRVQDTSRNSDWS